jgi:hypothetical protein
MLRCHANDFLVDSMFHPIAVYIDRVRCNANEQKMWLSRRRRHTYATRHCMMPDGGAVLQSSPEQSGLQAVFPGGGDGDILE